MRISDAPSVHVVVGAFASEPDARTAANLLRQAGIADTSMSLARGARIPAPGEMPTLSRVFWSGFWWSVIGAAAGAGLGLVVGLLNIGVPGTFENVGLQIASWAMFFHVLGALLGCYLVLDTGDRFSRKSDHHDSTSTLLRVSTPDAGKAQRAIDEILAAGGRIEESEDDVGIVSEVVRE